MSKKRSKIVKELDPQEIKGFSPARIEHYLSLGYRPYLNEEGHTKWLTPAQMTLRGTAGGSGSSIKNLLHPRESRFYKRRKRRSHWRSFLRENWPVILIVIVLAAATLVLLRYPNLIF
ncbi:MAG: hypothetical protein PHU99_01205 [Candidatus Cloacimonetes bacterium]|jgi:hypothetical protein|nr:hypothetical protein [Candidatus Cloacimonadota bacterium]MDY0337438.1 hypothetical protein [Candidatus Cloacimonadaceae bacterium]MCK9334644.1 hypothetical protein [Candidatus Cloacimonadota bacterium]MDD2544558.1 hypothetical protein [Candidatus Cloacimonadota bacterium]MDD3096324.1 hypothetical protein [Candidatus Cloacimonadota bacterium]